MNLSIGAEEPRTPGPVFFDVFFFPDLSTICGTRLRALRKGDSIDGVVFSESTFKECGLPNELLERVTDGNAVLISEQFHDADSPFVRNSARARAAKKTVVSEQDRYSVALFARRSTDRADKENEQLPYVPKFRPYREYQRYLLFHTLAADSNEHTSDQPSTTVSRRRPSNSRRLVFLGEINHNSDCTLRAYWHGRDLCQLVAVRHDQFKILSRLHHIETTLGLASMSLFFSGEPRSGGNPRGIGSIDPQRCFGLLVDEGYRVHLPAKASITAAEVLRKREQWITTEPYESSARKDPELMSSKQKHGVATGSSSSSTSPAKKRARSRSKPKEHDVESLPNPKTLLATPPPNTTRKKSGSWWASPVTQSTPELDQCTDSDNTSSCRIYLDRGRTKIIFSSKFFSVFRPVLKSVDMSADDLPIGYSFSFDLPVHNSSTRIIPGFSKDWCDGILAGVRNHFPDLVPKTRTRLVCRHQGRGMFLVLSAISART